MENMFDYILILLVILSAVANYFMGRYFTHKISKLFSTYRSETLKFSATQKENTEKLANLLNRLFITSEPKIKSEPNEVSKISPDEIEFAEENFMKLPNDLKFEVEGGDTSIPPGYKQAN